VSPARAIWKGVVCFGEARVPVKLYSAVEDRRVHFRLLHREDHVPVSQVLVNPKTDEVVPYAETLRGYRTEDGRVVLLDPQELAELAPEPSRDIRIHAFLPLGAIDHRWFARPYHLGPDGDPGAHAALCAALEETGREGLARWTMRNKTYAGALRLHQRHLMLISLRPAEEVVPVDALEPPGGPELDRKELSLAHRLMGLLEEEFDPSRYRDEYRERVLELIARKAKGESVEVEPVPRPPPSEDLMRALEESLEAEQSHG